MTEPSAITTLAPVPGTQGSQTPSELTPRQIVSELDRYIVGQAEAKRMVAIALRNRWRRKQLSEDIRDEVSPKNIIMIGPTGVGKTEIARRLARLAGAPFIKVEASKYTEVGYVGRDVESMVRDLLEIGISLVRKEMEEQIADRLEVVVEERLLDLLLPQPMAIADDSDRTQRTRDKLRQRLRAGALEDSEVEVEITESIQIPVMSVSGQGMEGMDSGGLEDFLSKLMPKNTKRRMVRVKDAREILKAQESQNLIDEDDLVARAKERVQNSGIIFIDEVDKIAVREGAMRGGEVSREGVQRDILPIVEGSTVATKHGPIDTKHILFIAAGAFHMAKPTDLIPELQGRFPIRVELSSLGAEDFERILSEPAASLTKQYCAMMETEGVTLNFTPDGIRAIADAAARVNEMTENIGARRLHTILERVLEEVLFHGPDMSGAGVTVDEALVEQRLHGVIEDRDLSRYIL